MLQNDALQQLAQLKSDLHSSRDLAQGTVRGTSGRFGFVMLDDEREAFLAPDKMQRVLPGDRVEVCLSESKEGKLEAELEKLISSELKTFVGQYIIRGQGHFVQPDMPQFSRWVFLPPKNRTKAKEGDFIHCKISRHPFHCEGKAQAQVTQIIGTPDDANIEHRYTQAKFELPNELNAAAQEESEKISASFDNSKGHLNEQREDLSAQCFVTIDSASTLDMDDALSVAVTDNGWQLSVAIADPSSLIKADSALDQTAGQRAQTVYLPGQALCMLPEKLSHDTFSLVEKEMRPVLLCRMNIASDGSIVDYHFHEALICSQKKLSYDNVSSFLSSQTLDTDTSTSEEAYLPENIQAQLSELKKMAAARQSYRTEHALLMEDKPDYHFSLNEQGKISHIRKIEKNVAHRIVEEAMLATNGCAGEFLAQHGGGLISSHDGFREERLEDIKLVLSDIDDNLATEECKSLEGYKNLIGTLQKNTAHHPTLAVLKRWLRAGELTLDDKPHMGLGLRHYATITSPIRRYHDLHNQRIIKNILRGETSNPATAEQAKSLQEQLSKGRQACRQMEQWLSCQYMQAHVGETFSGKVARVNSMGIGVQLDDNGIEGFVLMRSKGQTKAEKPSFDQQRLKITINEKSYQPDQPVTVKVDSVDMEKRQINLSLVVT